MKREGQKTMTTEARHWLTFQQCISTPDGEGGFVQSWADFFSCFGSVSPIRALQQFKYKSINVDATHYVRINGLSGLTTSTKRVGEEWEITWSGIEGETVQLHYRVNSGTWTLISSSEANDGSYFWTIPAAAAGRNVQVRVMHATDPESYVLTDMINVIDAAIVNRTLKEKDRIVFGDRVFEILTVENIQELSFEQFIVCKERR